MGSYWLAVVAAGVAASNNSVSLNPALIGGGQWLL